VADREELKRRLLATFQGEAREHLEAIQAELDALTSDRTSPDAPKRMEDLFRAVHTLKGAARSVGFGDVESVCHRSESLLRDMVKGQVHLTDALLRVLREVADGLGGLISGTTPSGRVDSILKALDRATSPGSTPAEPPAPQPAPTPKVEAVRAPVKPPEPAPPVPPPSPPVAPAPAAPMAATESDNIRVEVKRLDRLVVLAEELLASKMALAERSRQAREVTEAVRLLRRQLKGNEAFRELEAATRKLSLALTDDDKVLQRAVDDLIDETRHARMMPASTLFEAFPRMVRDLCRETGKEIQWQVEGTETNVDRKVLELVKDPLIHLVRNAVDHGIEPPAEREALGKPRQGTVSVRIAPISEGRITIDVSDDGRGLNSAAILDAAIRSRVVTSDEAITLDDEEAVDLAFRAGVSTSPVITRLSGRGLGLSIVRERVERIDGRVSVKSFAGLGCLIRIDMPTSIATYRGLLVRAGGSLLLWPADSVERAINLTGDDVRMGLTSRMVAHEGELLPFGRLSAALRRGQTRTFDEQRNFPCVVARGGGRRGVFLVDEVVGDSEALIKDLQPPLKRVNNIAAAGLLGTGELVLVLRPSDALLSLQAAEPSESAVAPSLLPRVRRLLVVDDSITTRTMERNLFESAGYSVRVAVDGQEAWMLLQSEEVDLVVSDIDMPRMDGFELTTRIRAHERTSELPVVLVTALEAREDKERGIRVGANAYVLKSTFDQSNLLEIVGRLI
jgi:two-component system, chemotaxis family, sensor kinase CheA